MNDSGWATDLRLRQDGAMSSAQHDAFTDPKAVASYSEGPARNVPGWADMIRMADLLLAEKAPDKANVLVVGAGGGLELKRFSQSHPSWTFLGVDPSAEMLKLARATVGVLESRVQLHEGYVETAPEGPFDGATCLLTLHFVKREQREPMMRAIRQRLRPGAPFVAAHLSFPQGEAERDLWLGRYAAFVESSGVDPIKAQAAAHAVGSQLTILSPEDDEAILRAAGFTDVQLFYAGFAFRGWVACA